MVPLVAAAFAAAGPGRGPLWRVPQPAASYGDVARIGAEANCALLHSMGSRALASGADRAASQKNVDAFTFFRPGVMVSLFSFRSFSP